MGDLDSEYKPLVIIGIEGRQFYETDREMLLRVMPHPAQDGEKDKHKQARVEAVAAANGQEQSGGKKLKNQKLNLKLKCQVSKLC